MSSAPALNAGDTAWLLAAAALVMLMTPAVGFFYGGLVRRKNVLSTLMHSWFILALISVQWVLWGYSVAFSPDTGLGIIGGLSWVGSTASVRTRTPTTPAPCRTWPIWRSR
jgi:Amt family ammonium transporter